MQKLLQCHCLHILFWGPVFGGEGGCSGFFFLPRRFRGGFAHQHWPLKPLVAILVHMPTKDMLKFCVKTI